MSGENSDFQPGVKYEFDRMKDSAQAATLGKFRDRLAHLAWLDALGPTEQWLEGIPPGKIAHFAGEARVTDAADMPSRPTARGRPRRPATITPYITHTIRRLGDLMLDLDPPDANLHGDDARRHAG